MKNYEIEQIEKFCSGCNHSSQEPLGLNPKGEPFLACCPDSKYEYAKLNSLFEVRNRTVKEAAEIVSKNIWTKTARQDLVEMILKLVEIDS